MEGFVWDLGGASGLSFGAMYLTVLFFTLLMCWDYPLLIVRSLFVRSFFGSSGPSPQVDPLPVLVVIPSLLRRRDELTSMMSTVESVASNGYPGDLTVVLSIDGTTDAPALYSELCTWAEGRRWNDRTALYVTGTPGRRSKPMAIDHAMDFVKNLVSEGKLPAFPPIYISTDADADLGPNAIEAIASRLQRRNVFTGAPARIVAGSLHVRGNDYWRGWRAFFTVAGQLNLQVAREYYVGNIWRFNVRAMPVTGVPGAFYCTWSEIYLAIPDFLGYLRTLRTRHWLGWWLGIAPPKFSESLAPPVPELVAGDTDDTVTAYMAIIARYEGGSFTWDPPRSPFHALYHLFQSVIVDRPIRYEPRAKVFTSSPTTVSGLFRQRKRWNTSRIELTLRFWRAIGYHWSLALPVMVVKALILRSVVIGAFVYIYVPLVIFPSHLGVGLVLGYACQVSIFATVTILALFLNREPRHWRLALALFLSPLYTFVFNWLPGAIGATCDVLLCGNVTGFSPEWTLKKGASVRIALFFRFRRAVMLMVRSALCGDVPLGRFWFGWRETPWTPSGFEGWTTGKKPPAIVPPREAWLPELRSWRARRRRSRP